MTEPVIVAAKPKPHPLSTLLASATRLTAKTLTRLGATAKGWQEDAWEMYDLVGEQRFLAHTLGGRLAQARLYVGQIDPETPTDDPDPIESETINAVLNAIGSSSSARAQLLERLAINLFIAGDGWLVGIPKDLMPGEQDSPRSRPLPRLDEIDGTLVIDDLEWRMLSVSEVSSNSGGEVTLLLSEQEKVVCSPDDIFLIRVWRPHPRKAWEADSPTRSSLPVLRELVGLTMHISAQVDSRLAGAGLLIVPQSAQRALQIAAGLDEADTTDQFTEALMEAMLTPIQDRASASAYVPLVVTVPDEVTDRFNYLTFAKPLDTESRNLRDEAIRRLALGQDAPPELLLGTAGMNHWGAWLVQEDVVTTHLEPPLALICDALTTQYLWPVLIDQGMEEETAHQYVIWYDVSDLVVRPNRSTDAMELHSRGVITDQALRGATGFDESDAPASVADQPYEVQMAFEMVRTTPALASNPGIPELVSQIRAVLNNQVPLVPDNPTDNGAPGATDGSPPSSPPPAPGPSGPGDGNVGVPTTDANPPSIPPVDIAASGARLMRWDRSLGWIDAEPALV